MTIVLGCSNPKWNVISVAAFMSNPALKPTRIRYAAPVGLALRLASRQRRGALSNYIERSAT